MFGDNCVCECSLAPRDVADECHQPSSVLSDIMQCEASAIACQTWYNLKSDNLNCLSDIITRIIVQWTCLTLMSCKLQMAMLDVCLPVHLSTCLHTHGQMKRQQVFCQLPFFFLFVFNLLLHDDARVKLSCVWVEMSVQSTCTKNIEEEEKNNNFQLSRFPVHFR